MSRYQPYRAREPNHAELAVLPDGSLALASSYDAGLVQALKQAVPWEARRWDGSNRRWIVAAQYGEQIARIVEAYLGVVVAVPQVAEQGGTETRLVYLEYLGQCKQRSGGESSAFGWVDGGWNLSVPEAVLRDWFEALPQRPDAQPTLYATLAAKPTATPEEVRSAYRRLARQWHPDVCHESDAATVFKAIQHAYSVLSNELLRRKYDAGRQFEASFGEQQSGQYDREYSALFSNGYRGYRAPLRCGWVLCEGQETLGRFVASKILGWEDITNEEGATMVASWEAGAETFQVAWR